MGIQTNSKRVKEMKKISIDEETLVYLLMDANRCGRADVYDEIERSYEVCHCHEEELTNNGGKEDGTE